MMQSTKRLSFGLVAVLAVALIAGCDSGPKMGEVSGTVTMDGAPAPSLEVSFEPKDSSLGTTAIGYTQSDGTYSLYYPGSKTGAPVGEYTVMIVPAESDEEGVEPPSVPTRYNSETELSFTVEAGSNTADFPLESK